jgi:hypothetical protein
MIAKHKLTTPVKRRTKTKKVVVKPPKPYKPATCPEGLTQYRE